MRAMERRELTQYEKETAERLKAIWLSVKKRRNLTQEDLKLSMGFKSQSAVSHYINGIIPLNTDSKIKFARFLNCKVTDFDPDFIEIGSLTDTQLQWLDVLDKLPEPVREKLADLAQQLASNSTK